MTDDERDRIARQAKEETEALGRIANLEKEVANMRLSITWGVRAIWGGVAYLAMQLWTFISQGGSLK